MPSIEQVTYEVIGIRNSSDQLSQMIASASYGLRSSAQEIAQIVRGSATGQDAVSAVNSAARSLSDAASSMKALSRTCDACVENLGR